MHWRTFERLCDELYDLAEEEERDYELRLRRMSFGRRWKDALYDETPRFDLAEVMVDYLERAARDVEREERSSKRG